MAVKKIIREYMPFIMLGYSLVFAILSYFKIYKVWFLYLPQFVGFSLITNIFMYSVYFNKKYCTGTKVAVIGLMICNLVDLVCTYFEVKKERFGFTLDNGLYDIVIILITLIISLLLNTNKPIIK